MTYQEFESLALNLEGYWDESCNWIEFQYLINDRLDLWPFFLSYLDRLDVATLARMERD